MHIYDYGFLENGLLPAELINITSTISVFCALSGERKNKNKSVYSELESIARIQSVKSSNAIEGIVTTDSRILEIVEGNSAPLNHNEREIVGYRNALDMIHSGYSTIQLNEQTILQLHKMMLSDSSPDKAGIYKTEDNLIIESDAFGHRSIRFKPVPADDTENAMGQLILAYIEARDNANTNPLLLIPCFILDFLCIHPFADGNGRVSRLLSLLLLYKSGFDISKYVSFEEQINEYKENYYEALSQSSSGWHENTNSYIPFIKNFLSTVFRCYKELDKRFSVVNGKKLKKSELIEQTVFNSIIPVSKSDICKLIPEVSPTTVEKVLGDMVKAGSVKKIGVSRATKYVRAEYVK